MLATLILCSAAVTAPPTDAQVKLLKTFRDEFIAVTPGQGEFPKSFTMGRDKGGHESERPAHHVTLAYKFQIAKYEVPQNLYEAVMGKNPSRWKGPRNSVELFSFDEAQQFCQRATAMMRAAKLITDDEAIRLPSEAEWEYTARAGSKTIFSFGDDVKALDAYGWHTGNAAGNDPPVGAKKPNAWGLYDVHGYLREWCLDAAHDNYQGAPTDGSAWLEGGNAKRRVIRGGSWKDKPEQLTSSYRLGVGKTFRDIGPVGADKSLGDDALGIRCVLASVAAGGGKLSADLGAFQPTAQSEFVPAGAKVELLWNEGEFTEGPALATDGSILFTDIGTRIMRFDPKSEKISVFRANSGKANGLMFDQQGRLIACEGASGGNRRISITDADGKVRTLSDNWQGKRFNSPNDLAIDGRGRVYFTDPRYQGDEPRDLDFEGVFLVDTDGKTTLATRNVEKPNGILVSLDSRYVYVADNNPQGNRHLVRFRVQKDGTLDEKKILFDFGDGGGRGIDGMTMDHSGNLYATAGRDELAGIYIFSSAGDHLAFIPTPGDPTNCVFGGGQQLRTLYIAAAGPKPADANEKRPYALYRIKLAKQGHHIVPLK